MTIPLTVGMMLLLVSSSFSQTNSPPVVEAGSDQEVIPWAPVSLSGTATDPDNDPILQWSWQVVSSPTGSSPSLTCSYCASPVFIGDLVGEYTLALSAYDGYAWSTPDNITITIIQPEPPVVVMTANPVSGTVPLTVQFDASQSYDPDNSALTFRWDFGDGLFSSTLSSPSYTYVFPSPPGGFEAEVLVRDEQNQYTTKTVLIHVLAPTQPLVVDAGPDQKITLGYLDPSRTLAATASGGTSPYTYSWSCPSWSSPQTGASVIVTPTVPTTYTVTATDANNQTATDDVYVNVLDWRCGNKLNKVTLCHNGHTICVAEAAVQAHLDIGDTPGGCQTSKSGRVVPGVFSLAQNYPNPFNPSTVIEYGLPEDGEVQLRVYDLFGREVERLVDETVQAGTYIVNYDGSKLPSGVYVYRLEWNGQFITRRMTLLK